MTDIIELGTIDAIISFPPPFAEQGSAEWAQARLGHATASRMCDVMATLKSGGYGASRANYMAELVCERLTGEPYPAFVSAAMQRGTNLEPEAKTAYTFYHSPIEPCGYILHPSIVNTGASPDGFVETDGLVEIKCPNTATHIQTLLTEKIDAAYIHQIQWGLECAEREWSDFISFDNRLPEAMSLFVKRVYRDEVMLAKMRVEVQRFLDDVHKQELHLRQKYGS